MLSAFVITLREGFEAALLVGLLLAVATRLSAPGARRAIWFGVLAAAVTSAAAGALLFFTGAELEGAAEAAFEGGAMLAAALVLAWMMLWMARHAHVLQTEVGERVAAAGSAAALFWLGFLVVVREGLETALLLFAAAGASRGPGTVAAGLAGLGLAAALGYAAYRGGSRLNVRTFFTVMNVLLLAVGTYLVWAGVGELGELAGGEAGELAGPLAAIAYAAAVGWLLFGRARTAGGSGKPTDGRRAAERSTGAAGRAPAGSPSRR